MTDIKVHFLRSLDEKILDVVLDDSITAQEAITELLAADFIKPFSKGYSLVTKSGKRIDSSQSFANASIFNETTVRIVPGIGEGDSRNTSHTDSASKKYTRTCIPGLEKSEDDKFRIQDIVSSPEAMIMLIHAYEDVTFKYEKQSKQLEYEKMRAQNGLTSTILLLISQVILSIGTNLLTEEPVVAYSVLAAGILQTSLAIYLTFKN